MNNIAILPPSPIHCLTVDQVANVEFDAYYNWLGIPHSEQPPTHYRLLGITEFEENPEVIEHCADRQMAHIRTLQIGPYQQLVQRLLSEISVARRCLLSTDQKANYDLALRSRDEQYGASPFAVVETLPIKLNRTRYMKKRKDGSFFALMVQIVFGGVAGLSTSILALWLFAGMDVFGIFEPKQSNSPAARPTFNESERPISQVKSNSVRP